MSLWIKICGNTTLEDAQLAAEAGADALGFVFAPSPRRVTVERTAAMVPHLPAAIEKIGVFVDAALDEIASTVERCCLTGVQLHFDAGPALAAQLRERFGAKLRILRVVHLDAQQRSGEGGLASGHSFSGRESSRGTVEALASKRCLSDPNVDAILVDSRTGAAVGGTGQAYDWTLAGKILFQNAETRKPLVAAGGLTPENVAEAIGTLRPWGVDVVTGVEAAPGRKDPSRVLAFIANARSAG
jgi:phosphoribosylanthranilate isomerase